MASLAMRVFPSVYLVIVIRTKKLRLGIGEVLSLSASLMPLSL